MVGPVIEIERQHAVAGLRRSAHLVRPHFWRVAAFGTLPLFLSNGWPSCPTRPGPPTS
ncbi:MAG TPA: hypothetical protein VF933_17660 [Streptosporangiaceae bacterium]